MLGAMEINLPGGRYQGRGLESAGSGARILGELKPILPPRLEFQSLGLQSVKRNKFLWEKSKDNNKGCKRILTGPGDLRIEADTVASLSEEEDSEVTTTCLRGIIRLF